jgi:hypothetical protein
MVPGGPRRTHTHPGSGLQVCLKRVKGLTKRGLLKRPYYFQVAPLEEFGWDTTVNFADYEVMRFGQFTRGGSRALRTVSFESLVVDYNPPWAVLAGGNHHRRYDEDGGAPIPRRVSDELDRIALAATPFRLIVWNHGLDERAELNWIVTFRSFSARERAGEVEGRYFNFGFVEYRRTTLRRKGASGGGGSRGHDLPATVRVDAQGIAREFSDDKTSKEDHDEHLHQQGHQIGTKDHPATLRQLAVHFYGESNRWREIAAWNGVTGLGPDEAMTRLDRRGRKARVLTIPVASWDAKTGLSFPARAVKVR